MVAVMKVLWEPLRPHTKKPVIKQRGNTIFLKAHDAKNHNSVNHVFVEDLGERKDDGKTIWIFS